MKTNPIVKTETVEVFRTVPHVAEQSRRYTEMTAADAVRQRMFETNTERWTFPLRSKPALSWMPGVSGWRACVRAGIRRE